MQTRSMYGDILYYRVVVLTNGLCGRFLTFPATSLNNFNLYRKMHVVLLPAIYWMQSYRLLIMVIEEFP